MTPGLPQDLLAYVRTRRLCAAQRRIIIELLLDLRDRRLSAAETARRFVRLAIKAGRS